MKRLACGLLAAVAVACGGATVGPLGDGGADAVADAPVDSPHDAPPDGAGPWACGATTCQGTDLCIHPCCGGAPPPCVPLDDAGVCPDGYVESSQCYNLGGTNYGCAPPPCTPPPPYCSPGPSPNCSQWGQQTGRDCYEVCA
jgi:hypothetical protein